MRARSIAALVATAPLLIAVPAAEGAAGFPDSSFGAGGFTKLEDPPAASPQLSDVVVQADGKIVGAGDRGGSLGFLLARVNPDGSPDGAFGSGGIRVEPDTGMVGAPRSIAAVVQRADGKILAAGLGRGEGKNAFEFARYLADGSLDPSFGTGGLRLVPVTPSGFANAVALAPDQKVVAVGANGEGKEAAVVRLTEEGVPDGTFNLLGIRYLNVPESSNDEAHAVSVLPDGTILLAGLAGGRGAFLAELNVGGNPVPGFGTAGIAVHDLGTAASPTGAIKDLSVLPDGRIVATGAASTTTSGDSLLFVARFTPSGDLDPSFGSGGVFRSNPTGREDAGFAIETLADGRIVVAGSRDEGKPGTGETLILRLTPDGQLDTGFGSGGETASDAGLGIDRAQGLALQPDGRAVIAGFADEPAVRKLLIGRFTSDEVPIAPIDEARGPRCRGRVATITGTPRRDRLRGTPRRDVIVGLGGNDRIAALAGNDLVCAGAGKDVVKAGKGRDTVNGGAGPDSLFGGPGLDLLLGGPGNDRLVGGKGRRDLCNGGGGRRDRAGAGCERRRRVP